MCSRIRFVPGLSVAIDFHFLPSSETTIVLTATADKEATITTDKVDGKDVVTAIKIDTAKKKKKKAT